MSKKEEKKYYIVTKEGSFCSLRHSVGNKYLIGGWPTSCALKSYLSFCAFLLCKGRTHKKPCSRNKKKKKVKWRKKRQERRRRRVKKTKALEARQRWPAENKCSLTVSENQRWSNMRNLNRRLKASLSSPLHKDFQRTVRITFLYFVYLLNPIRGTLGCVAVSIKSNL